MTGRLFLENGPAAILAAAFITYLFRFGGLLLADRLPQSGPLRSFLDALPGTILLSLVVPAAVGCGWQGIIGIIACLTVFLATRRLLPTMFGGVFAVYLLRLIS